MIVGSSCRVVAVLLAITLLTGCRTGADGRIGRCYSLARRPTEGNKHRIEAMLADRDRDVRTTALVVMGGVDPVRARAMALRSLEDPDGMVRAAAVELCAEGADAETVRRLAALSIDDPVWHVRARSLEAIASSDDPAAREALVRALSDPVRHVRRAALRAGIDRPELLPVEQLSRLLATDPDWETRVDAATALGASRESAAYAGLAAAAADPNEFVRATAARERRELERAGIPP